MRGKKTNMDDVVLKITWVDPNTLEGKASWDNGFRILARWIARAYMKDQAEKNTQQQTTTSSLDQELSTFNSEKLCQKEASTFKIDGNKLLEKRLGLTVHEAAELLGLKDASIYKAIKIGQIPSVNFGKRIIIPKEALIEILSRPNNQVFLNRPSASR